MAFRKRNVGVAARSAGQPEQQNAVVKVQLPGVRPSPLDGRLTTSTGTSSLDALLSGHSGLPLGNSMLIEENGTTDFSGALLKFYASEGIVQGHRIVTIGSPPGWEKELPGASVESTKKSPEQEKMKIAWRYEQQGRERQTIATTATTKNESVFCHSFDLRTKLAVPSEQYTAIPSAPLESILAKLDSILKDSPVCRVIVSGFLSPTFGAGSPSAILQFVHGLKGLLDRYSRTTLLMTLPVSLYPRETALVRWIELISDGVVELTPFPHSASVPDTSVPGESQEEQPHGMAKLHKLPVFHESGGSMAVGLDDDYVFTLTRRQFVIKKFSLPPLEGDTEAQQAATDKKAIEF